MKYVIFDIEGNGLLDTITKIHCLSFRRYDNTTLIEKGSFTKYSDISNFIRQEEILVGHNIITYDIPVLEKILHIKINAELIDTLALSWYLYPSRIKHGLELWGDELGVKKPIILDWENLKVSDYVNRCTTDVAINSMLFHKQMFYLLEIYGKDENMIRKLIRYLSFKMDCVREQTEVRCKINRPLIDRSLEELYILQEEKIRVLTEAMPLNIKHKVVKKPAKMLKKDGSSSVTGNKWLNLCYDNNFPQDYEGDITVIVSEEPGNPVSSIQIKNWLFALGWEPITFVYKKNSKDEPIEVPQIYVDDEVCRSIKTLYPIEPALESLDMLSLINHRIGIFNSFLDNASDDDRVIASMHGFTNTLRIRHKKPVVNLPKIFKFYGEQIRGAIIAPEGHILCGSDMSSLEDSTKQHYMFFFDPEYVKQMRVPGFDPHLDIAVLAKMLTPEQVEEHKLYGATKGEQGVNHSEVRGKAKTVNFAGIYGAGPPKIALSTGMPLRQAQQLHKTYWERNKAVKQVSEACIVKTVGEQKWLFNPVSKFWYSLRIEKDRFSTLNQGTGVYCFDNWVREVRNKGVKIMLQYHDEIAFPLLRGKEEETESILKQAIITVNEKIKLNVELGISVDFGDNYAQIH